MHGTTISMLDIRQALEASWKPDTAYHHAEEKGNPALGQCYVTARVIQYYYPEAEIVEGEVATNAGVEKHFWNIFRVDGQEIHLDTTWQQFPPGSTVKSWKVRDRDTLNDSEPTIRRFNLLLQRVKQKLDAR